MIKANGIQNMNHVKQILDNLKKHIRSSEVQFGGVSEEIWINIRFQLCEIDEFVIGVQSCNKNNFVNADLRMMSYHEYLNNECNFDELVENLRKYEGDV